MAKPIPQTFELHVINQQGSVFQDTVQAVATGNEAGELSILSGHSNFISIITEPLEIHTQGGSIKEIELELGVIRVFDNVVEIYVGIEIAEDWQKLAEATAP